MDSWLSHFSLFSILFPTSSRLSEGARAKHSCCGCVVSVAELTWPGDPSNLLFLSFPEQRGTYTPHVKLLETKREGEREA